MNAPSDYGRGLAPQVFRKCLVYLFLLGLIVRAGFMVAHAHTPSYGALTLDQKYYDMAARMILTGQDLHQLRGLRPLLYPLFLAALYKIGGSQGIDLAIAVQHLLGVLTGLLVAMLGARVFRHRAAGLAGGVLYLLAPVPLCFEGELLIESSYVFLVCLGLLLAFRAAEMPDRKGALLWLAGGALTMLTAQARANILVFMAVYALLAAWHWWRSRRAPALLPLWAFAGTALMAGAWGFVNNIQSDHFQVMPTAGSFNLYFGNRRGADGMEPEQGRRATYSGDRYQDSSEIWAREEYEAAMRAQGHQPSDDPGAFSKYWTRRALDEIKADPAAWLRLMAKKCWLMFWNAEVPNNKAFAFLQTENVWLRLLPVRWVVLLMLAPAGLWAASKWGNRDSLLILLAYIGLYSAANTAFFICDRYRYPIWPAVAALAGGGLVILFDYIRRRRWPAVAGVAGSMAVMAAISLPNWFDARLPSFARDYLFRSIAWYEKGHFNEALGDIDRSLALDPSDVTALHHRGNVLLALNRLGEACQDYEQTLKINADDAGIWNNYGFALDGLGRTNEALQAFRRAAECKPPSLSAFLAIAFEQIRAGRLDDASAALNQLAKLQPGPDAMALGIRSVIARRQGDPAKAGSLEAQARQLDAKAATWAIDRASSAGPIRP